MTQFDSAKCQILGANHRVIAQANSVGRLYFLNCKNYRGKQQLHTTERLESKESIWLCRYGHLGEQNLQKLARRILVDKFDFDSSKQIGFCETCVGGKHHRSQFPTGEHTRAKELLGLVHSAVCGKINNATRLDW